MVTSSPRWLDDDEARIWIGWVLSSRLLWDELERDLQRDSQMPFSYYEVLVILSESPARSRRMSELADLTQSSRSRLSHAMTRLEALGWVRRDVVATDRRGAVAVLTDEGFAALEAAAPAHVESVRQHLFDQLSPAQLDQLREISDALLDHLLPILCERDDGNVGRLEMARARLGRAAPVHDPDTRSQAPGVEAPGVRHSE